MKCPEEDYMIEIESRGKGIYSIRRVNGNDDDYVLLIGDVNFMQKLGSALKEAGF